MASIIRSQTGTVEDECAPEALIFASIEILDAHALLLDPGIVAEVEDALALGKAQLEHVVVGNAVEVLPENLTGVDFVEAVRIAPAR